MRRRFVGVLCFFLFLLVGCGGNSDQVITFEKTFGGTGDESGYSVQQTADGGFVLAGYTDSIGAGRSDAYLIRTDNFGNLLWEKTYGDASGDYVYALQQTLDTGFVLAGVSNSSGPSIFRTDPQGNLLWQRTFGVSFMNSFYSVQQTSDGGFVLAGRTDSIGAGSLDAYLLRTDSLGNVLWQKAFGGPYYDAAYAVQQTADGGFVLAGETTIIQSSGGNAYLIRTDNQGNMLWQKTFAFGPRIGGELINSVQQTSDGGFVLTGTAGGANSAYAGLIRTDGQGEVLWQKTFDGANFTRGNSVRQTADGGFVLAGTVDSDGYLIRTDSQGNLLWQKTYGGTSDEGINSVIPTGDGGFVMTGWTDSFGAGGSDVYLVRTDAQGNLQ